VWGGLNFNAHTHRQIGIGEYLRGSLREYLRGSLREYLSTLVPSLCALRDRRTLSFFKDTGTAIILRT